MLAELWKNTIWKAIWPTLKSSCPLTQSLSTLLGDEPEKMIRSTGKDVSPKIFTAGLLIIGEGEGEGNVQQYKLKRNDP